MRTRRLIFVLGIFTLSGVGLFVIMGHWNISGLALLGYLLAFFGAAALIPLTLKEKFNKPWSKE